MKGVLSCLAGLALAFPIAAAEDYRIHSRIVPAGYEREAAFFELVKWPSPPEGMFDASKAPKWDVKSLGDYISENGITFTDANKYLEGHKSKKEILRSLNERKGHIFQAFAHLSHIYSVPYKQYSELSFGRTATASVVTMAGWYKLTFQREGASSRIIRWEYTQLEGD